VTYVQWVFVASASTPSADDTAHRKSLAIKVFMRFRGPILVHPDSAYTGSPGSAARFLVGGAVT